MAATEVVLTFDDGRKETVRINVGAMIAAERHFGATIPRLEGAAYAAWVRLGRPGQFEEWADKIDDVEEVDDHPQTAGPEPG